ncbi:MAG: S9 family peptidase, partial [Chloroflexota bacterium]
MTDMSSIPLIPRHVLFGNPDKTMARLSPDGQQLAYLAPLDGVLNVWVGPADKPGEMKPVTDDTVRGIRFYAWAYSNKHILYIQDKGGDENWHLFSVNLDSGEIKNLTPLEGVQAQVLATSPDTPEEIIVGLNDRDAQLHDLYRVDINSGERSLIQQNDGYMSFVLDEGYNVRFANRMRPDGGFDMLRVTGEDEWPLFLEVSGEDLLTTNVIGFDRSGEILYMTGSIGRDTAALYAVDPETGERTLLAEDARSDAGDVMIHPTEKRVQAVSFNYVRKEWRILDEGIEKELALLKSVTDGEVEIVSRTLDDQTWLAAYLMDDGPVRYYRFDRRQMSADFLFTDRQALEDQPLVKMHSA